MPLKTETGLAPPAKGEKAPVEVPTLTRKALRAKLARSGKVITAFVHGAEVTSVPGEVVHVMPRNGYLNLRGFNIARHLRLSVVNEHTDVIIDLSEAKIEQLTIEITKGRSWSSYVGTVGVVMNGAVHASAKGAILIRAEDKTRYAVIANCAALPCLTLMGGHAHRVSLMAATIDVLTLKSNVYVQVMNLDRASVGWLTVSDACVATLAWRAGVLDSTCYGMKPGMLGALAIDAAGLRMLKRSNYDMHNFARDSAAVRLPVNDDGRGHTPYLAFDYSNNEWRVISGCRDFTIVEAIIHWDKAARNAKGDEGLGRNAGGEWPVRFMHERVIAKVYVEALKAIAALTPPVVPPVVRDLDEIKNLAAIKPRSASKDAVDNYCRQVFEIDRN